MGPVWLFMLKKVMANVQNNSRVVSRRRCVLNSQLVHDGFGREIENWKCWEFIQTSWLHYWKLVPTADGWVPTARHNSTWLSVFSFQFLNQIRRQSSWTSCEFDTHRATPTQLNSTVELTVGFTAALLKLRYWAYESTGQLGRNCVQVKTIILLYMRGCVCLYTNDGEQWL